MLDFAALLEVLVHIIFKRFRDSSVPARAGHHRNRRAAIGLQGERNLRCTSVRVSASGQRDAEKDHWGQFILLVKNPDGSIHEKIVTVGNAAQRILA